MFISTVLNPIINNIESKGDNPVLIINNKTYCYRDLGEAASSIRLQLRNKGLTHEKIGLVINNDLESYASILALWLDGSCYVPLNPKWPLERCLDIIKQCSIRYILDSSNETRYMSDIVIKTNGLKSNSLYLEPLKNSSQDNAYILFTSGSTGNPKGVQISRQNVAAFVDSLNNIGLQVSENDKFLQPFDLSFDFSVSGYLIPLIIGASMYTIDSNKSKIMSIAKLLLKYDLTVLQMVPSMMRNLLPYLEEFDLSSIKYNIFCGEALSAQTIKRWHSANRNMITYNMYGPTEDTVFCTYYLINSSNIENFLHSDDTISVGKTFKNNYVMLLDSNNKEITDENVEGELCLAGDQLTPGYWKNDKDNHEKFFTIDDVRWYRSGDLCYYGTNKNIMYIGRIDNQVKINGFRVELGEIESKYSKISNGRFSIAVPYVDEQNNTLIALIVESEEYDYKKHLEDLRRVLPPYEVPSSLFFLPKLPLNQNGKIDRGKVKALFNLK